MAKYVINENSDLQSLARQVEEIAARQQNAAPGEAIVVHEVVAEETAAARPARARTPTRRNVLLLSIGIGVAVIAMACVGVKLLAMPGSHPVPNVVDMRIDDARTIMAKAGFIVVIEYEASSKRPAGMVVAQVPAANKRESAGAKVTVRVAGKAPGHSKGTPRNSAAVQPGSTNTSKTPVVVPINPTPPVKLTNDTKPTVQEQPKKLTVPAVEGSKAEDARKVLRALGLNVTEATVNDAGKPDGVVLGSEPKAGSDIQPGATVRLRINVRPNESAPVVVERPPEPRTPAMLIVQDYVGMDGKDAANDLRSRGLNYEWRYEFSNRYTVNTVIVTDPPAGSRIQSGGKIYLVLAR